jgi:hypothetical protein
MDVDAAKDAIMSAAIAILEINEAVGNPVPSGYEEAGSRSNANSESSVSNNGLNTRSVISGSTASSVNTKAPLTPPQPIGSSGNSPAEQDNINRQNTNLQRIQVNQPETGNNYLNQVYKNTPSLQTANQLGGRRATKKRAPRRRRRTQRRA